MCGFHDLLIYVIFKKSLFTLDPLYENIKFADMDKALVPSKPKKVVKIPENLQEYVKQDFK